MQGSQPKVAIVLVDWNNHSDTASCVKSLMNLQYSNYEIIVVDNGSVDPIHSSGVFSNTTIVRLERNHGFAGGNNEGIKTARVNGAEYIWMLNNDTEVDAAALTCLMELAAAQPRYLFYGSVIAFHSSPGTVWYGRGSINTINGSIRNDYYNQPVNKLRERYGRSLSVGWISGCSILFHASVVDKIGYLADDFFLYREELEWELRAAAENRCMILTRPLVFHKVGRTTGKTENPIGWFFMSRNYIKIAMKYSTWPLWLLRWMVDYLLVPLLKGRVNMVWLSMRSLMWYQTPGEIIVKRLRSNP